MKKSVARFPAPPRVVIALALPICHAAELRPLSTDRPDTTESPYTVDAGYFQLEMEIGNWTRDGSEREFSLGELNSKIGLDPCNDLQVVLPFYTCVRNGGEGFGDVQIRLKHNFWGNDSGDTALAIMPFVKLPTANGDLGNGDWEGGIIVPFGFSGPNDWAFGVQGELDLEADDDGQRHLVFLSSATTSHPLTETTGFFLELVSILSTSGGEVWEAYFNTGLTWAVTPTWQLDGGIRTGLTDASADFMPFLGLSTKF